MAPPLSVQGHHLGVCWQTASLNSQRSKKLKAKETAPFAKIPQAHKSQWTMDAPGVCDKATALLKRKMDGADSESPTWAKHQGLPKLLWISQARRARSTRRFCILTNSLSLWGKPGTPSTCSAVLTGGVGGSQFRLGSKGFPRRASEDASEKPSLELLLVARPNEVIGQIHVGPRPLDVDGD